jgi:DNA-binding transcriptional ArsR family regulator
MTAHRTLSRFHHLSAILNHVVKNQLDDVFAALADQTRRAIVADLARHGSRTVGELAAPHAISLPAVSKHVSVLQRAGLVDRRRDGRSQICTLNPRSLQSASAWLRHYDHFWNERIDALERYVSEEKP